MTNTRPRFRDTLWFMKGEKDAQAAQEGAGDPMHPQAVDLLPAEDRYLDDGNIQPSHSATFGVRTGTTEYLPKLDHNTPGGTTLNTALLIGELKGGRRRVFAALGASALALVAVVAIYAL